MAQTSWTQSFANFFKKKAVVSARSCEPFLEFSRRILEEVRTMTSRRDSKSSVVVNYEQCVYLVDRLDKAVEKASLFLEHNRHLGEDSASTEDVRESSLESLKILCMLAKKVKCFIQSCCNGYWLQAAVMLTNFSECTASLGFDLKWFRSLSPSSDFRIYPGIPLSIGEVSTLRHVEGELVKEMASNDEDSLVTKLRALIEDGQASGDDLELATFLLERLDRMKRGLPSVTPGSLQPILHERDLRNLKDMVQIASSGFSIVRRASWLGMDVAVKTFHGTDNPDFMKEVEILAGLSHPNIVSYICHGEDMGECSIVMELMDGDLFSLLKERRRSDRTRSFPFSVFEEFDIILQIAEAMDYLHEMKVLHRDLKSLNILVRCLKSPNAEGYEHVQVKVSDFLLSRREERSMTHSDMTLNVGTVRWMAPELIIFWNTNDIRDIETTEVEELVENYPFKCDVYSFGMVCLEILTGDVPFPNMTPYEVRRAVCAGERPQLPDRCPEKLKALIGACWNPEARSRPCFGDICTELRYLKSLHMTLSARSREPCLEFSRRCVEEVRIMTSRCDSKSSEVINYEQCVYLVDILDKAVQKASLFFEHNRHLGGDSVSTEDVRVERLKILCMLAKKVKYFIESCCNGHWLHTAVILTNFSECTASLGFDLKWFRSLSPSSDFRIYPGIPLSIGEVSTLRHVEGELVKEMASNDEYSLVTKLRALIQDGRASIDDLELATFLLERLDRMKRGLPSVTPGSLQPILHERDLTNLKHMVQIGRGGFSIVRRASWFGMDVAVKTFHGTDNPDFMKEVEILAGLSHPNIVSFLWFGEELGYWFVVMELMDQDLFSLLKERLRSDRTRSSPFSVFEEFDLMLQIAEAVDYLHKMRLLHRDLKSANILVRCLKSPNAEGYEHVQVKVSDFGLSKTKERSMTQSHMTPNMGTTKWMAPELMKYCNTNDIRDIETTEVEELVENYPFKGDVYSFGMVCLEILTGDVPFPNMTPYEVRRAVCAGERPQLPDRCPEKLKALIGACWNPEASSRPCFGDICTELRYLKSLHMTGNFAEGNILDRGDCSVVYKHPGGRQQSRSGDDGLGDQYRLEVYRVKSGMLDKCEAPALGVGAGPLN